MTERIAIIGYGAIGAALAASLATEGSQLSAVLLRAHLLDRARQNLPAQVALVDTFEAMMALRPALVIEAAGQGAVRDHAAFVLAAGIDLMVVSTGAFAARFAGLIERIAAAHGARILIPAGAIAGLDGLGALKAAGLTSVTYTSTKPPLAWRGTPAEAGFDLAAMKTATTIFEGPAREAALAYPKNANLAATVALAGLGLDATRVRLVADPVATGNTGMIEASSAIGDMRVVMAGGASANPKTSASTAYSLLHAVRNRSAAVVI